MAKQSITDILKIDYRSYDDYRFTSFFGWCNIYAEWGIPLQALTTSKPLYKWYCQQWQGVVEKAFKADLKSYLDAHIDDPLRYAELITDYPKAIEKNYPQVILNMIKSELKPTVSHEKTH